MLTKLHTVNVVECSGGTIQSLLSYLDNEDGCIQAEIDFGTKALNHGAKEEELDAFIEDGKYSDGDGYVIYLVHSTQE